LIRGYSLGATTVVALATRQLVNQLIECLLPAVATWFILQLNRLILCCLRRPLIQQESSTISWSLCIVQIVTVFYTTKGKEL
jgi:uncharacterized membrane protein